MMADDFEELNEKVDEFTDKVVAKATELMVDLVLVWIMMAAGMVVRAGLF